MGAIWDSSCPKSRPCNWGGQLGWATGVGDVGTLGEAFSDGLSRSDPPREPIRAMRLSANVGGPCEVWQSTGVDL